jgi:nitroreductase
MKSDEKIDQLQLGQLIRFNAHMLDIATRTKNPDIEKKNQEARNLEKYLDFWQKKKFPQVSYISWAEQKLQTYKNWLSTRKLMVTPFQEETGSHSVQDLQQIIRERRSIRFWKKKAVPGEMIRQILEAGTYAPSAFNRLPWRFFIAETPLTELKDGDASNTGMFEQAPVRIFVAVDERLFFEKYSGALDAGLAMQNMLLTAHSLGLGTCLIYQGEFIDKNNLEKFYKIPSYCTVYCAILLGYPDEKPDVPERMPVEEISVFLGEIPNPVFD